ncbi:MAG: replication initiator protein A [Bacteroidota bacterium]
MDTSSKAPPSEDLTTALDLVRVEHTIDSQPIWAPSKYADEVKRVYPLKWRGNDASVTVQASGEYGMMRAFDKLVLTALVHFWNDQGRPKTGHVSFQIIDIIRALNRKDDGKTYELIKRSLHRLRGCLIQYQLSFFDTDKKEWTSLRDKNILTDLLIVEPRREGDTIQLPLSGMTYAVFDFEVVKNLLGNFTRPVSLRLLQTLSERGMLFESYINAVLYRHATVKKDVFELWADLGLRTRGINYGSQLASRMRKDLDKIASDEASLLGNYDFEKSKTRARSQNLILIRKQSADLSLPKIPKQQVTSNLERFDQQSRSNGEIDQIVEWLKMELHDESESDTNLRVIAQRMPEGEVKKYAYEAFAAYRDGKTGNPAAYYVGMMKNRAAEMGIDLGFSEASDHQTRQPPKPINMRRGKAQTGGPQSLADLASRISIEDGNS